MATAATEFYDTQAVSTLAEKKRAKSEPDDAPASKGVHYTGVLIGCIIMLVIIVLVYVFQNQAKEYFSRGAHADVTDALARKIRELEKENVALRNAVEQVHAAKKKSVRFESATQQIAAKPTVETQPAETQQQDSKNPQDPKLIENMLNTILTPDPKPVEEKQVELPADK